MTIAHLMPSLEPKLRQLYNDHTRMAAQIDWSYHEYLPLAELRADPNSIPKLSSTVYLAVETALMTEINLPWFTTHLASPFQRVAFCYAGFFAYMGFGRRCSCSTT